MNILLDVINKIDDIRKIEGVEKLKEKLDCVSEENFYSSKELTSKYSVYTDYLMHMYNEYVDDEVLKRNGWIKHDVMLLVDRKGNKEILKPFMSDIGIEGFPYSDIGYKKEDGDTFVGYQYGIVVNNPEKFSDSKANIEILKNNAFAHIKYEDMFIIDKAIEDGCLVSIEPRYISRITSKPYDVDICIRIVTK